MSSHPEHRRISLHGFTLHLSFDFSIFFVHFQKSNLGLVNFIQRAHLVWKQFIHQCLKFWGQALVLAPEGQDPNWLSHLWGPRDLRDPRPDAKSHPRRGSEKYPTHLWEREFRDEIQTKICVALIDFEILEILAFRRFVFIWCIGCLGEVLWVWINMTSIDIMNDAKFLLPFGFRDIVEHFCSRASCASSHARRKGTKHGMSEGSFRCQIWDVNCQ